DRVVGKLGDELLDRRVRIEPHFGGIRAHEGAAEDSSGEAVDVVALERFERADGDLRGVGDLTQRNPAALARVAQLAAETAGRPINRHDRARQPRLCYQPDV